MVADIEEALALREAADRVRRFGEELDAIRDRAQIVHDQIMDQLENEEIHTKKGPVFQTAIIAGVMGAYFLLYARSRVLCVVPFVFFVSPDASPATRSRNHIARP